MFGKVRSALAAPGKTTSHIYNTARRFGATYGNDAKQLTVGEFSSEFMIDTVPNFEYINRFPEQDVLEDLLPRLSPDDVFWDVGANVGLYSCFAGNLGVEVVSFEPDEPTRSTLLDNVALNDIDGTVLPYGLDNESGEIQRELNMQRENRPTTVETRTGDGIVSGDGNTVPAPTVVKIDIEGMELAALRGMSDVIENVRLIYVELHPEYLSERGESPEQVKSWLSNRGFELSGSMNESGNPIIRGEK